MPIIGTCSNCQGPVQTPELWGGDAPPVPTCTSCGATAKNPFGPVIAMKPAQDPLSRIRDLRSTPAPRGGWKP